MTSVVVPLLFAFAAQDLPSWAFDDPAEAQAWVPNEHVANVAVKDGALCADAVKWDPMFFCTGLSFPATPWQYVVIRVKASQTGSGELFWTGTEEGPFGGFSQERSQRWEVAGDGEFHEVPVFPFWQAEGTIKKLRLDLFDGAHFEIDSISVRTWGTDQEPITGLYFWNFASGNPWQTVPGAAESFAPPLKLPIEDRHWVTVELQSDRDGAATILWASEEVPGLQSESFAIRKSERPLAYNVPMEGNRAWKSPLLALGIRLPEDAAITLQSISIGEEPDGPPELAATYFGFENAVNRAGAPVSVFVRVKNLGGGFNGVRGVQLIVPEGLAISSAPEKPWIEGLAFDEYADLAWTVVAERAGVYTVQASFEGKNAPEGVETTLAFTEPLSLPQADYVPEPRPVETTMDVAAYYFPGWESAAKWDCVREIAPIRKPLLGYYDESNPECVDWQIKWAAENGITVFLVDWYWIKGNQHLTHWFEAYKKSRYRDSLKVAIMWANHNPPNTHSREDWVNVTREWIDQYFSMDSYYRINGKPALFLWDPRNLRNDLGGSEGAKAALDDSQRMAREAGYEGVEFVAVNTAESPAFVEMLAAEGYAGATNYHEWGSATDNLPAPQRAQYEDVVATAPAAWARRDAMCAPLTYYPLVDTGWDSRPWHGDKSLVIQARTPERFERLLREAKAYCDGHGKSLVILGPVNEWGEGSYIEPCTEYGFAMLEAIRRVFVKGEAASWPVNVAPGDVGRGPYDYPPAEAVTSWDFNTDAGGWRNMMGLGNFRVEGGALCAKSVDRDPAIVVSLTNVRASAFTGAVVDVRIAGDMPEAIQAQLFWTRGAGTTSEAASAIVPLARDGQSHTYAFDLAAHPRWRGSITSLRFDPCNAPGLDIAIDSFRLE
ncbi:MAG: glycoside hydrolase family 99-like domain-containing protein [Candidatus Hydrogenedentes bacterium]|nr:glycoside hydrolase family 99-like domain-containing protein [Candidatus Hydrogenedentota bacterium]